MKSAVKHPHSHSHHAAPHRQKRAEAFEGPRQLAPAVMGRRAHSRHTAMMAGSVRAEHWLQFASNRRFWIIAMVASVGTLAFLWTIKDLPALPRGDWAAIRAMQNWKPTFFMRQQPAVIENGKVIQPAETYYTVPSKLTESR